MLLNSVRSGNKVRLVAVKAGMNLQRRLAEMGLVPGVEFEVIENSRKGPFLVALKGARLILGRGMTDKISVV